MRTIDSGLIDIDGKQIYEGDIVKIGKPDGTSYNAVCMWYDNEWLPKGEYYQLVGNVSNHK